MHLVSSIQDEKLRLRERIAGRLADRRQMSSGGDSFHTSNASQIQQLFRPSKRDLAAVRKNVVDVPPCPSHAARKAPRRVRFRLAAEVSARRQSFANTAFVADRGSEGVSLWKFVYAARCDHIDVRSAVLFKVNFADTALASDFGDVEPCRIEVLQPIQYVGGTRVVCREPPIGFLAFLGHSARRRSCDSRPGWARKQWGGG